MKKRIVLFFTKKLNREFNFFYLSCFKSLKGRVLDNCQLYLKDFNIIVKSDVADIELLASSISFYGSNENKNTALRSDTNLFQSIDVEHFKCSYNIPKQYDQESKKVPEYLVDATTLLNIPTLSININTGVEEASSEKSINLAFGAIKLELNTELIDNCKALFKLQKFRNPFKSISKRIILEKRCSFSSWAYILSFCKDRKQYVQLYNSQAVQVAIYDIFLYLVFF